MKRKKNKIEQSGNNFQKLAETVRQLDEERNALTRSHGSRSEGSMYNCWCAFVDIRLELAHQFPTYGSWICSDDPEARAFRQGWAARQCIADDPKRYPIPPEIHF